VSLAALRAFADEHRGSSFILRDDARGSQAVFCSFLDLTTAQVVEYVIKPATLAALGGAEEEAVQS
jgi:hypothetical protein